MWRHTNDAGDFDPCNDFGVERETENDTGFRRLANPFTACPTIDTAVSRSKGRLVDIMLFCSDNEEF